MDTHQDRLSDDGSSGVGAQRSPSVVMFMRRPLIVATVLESAAPKLMGKKASASYRADLLQEPEKKSDTTLADVGKRLIAGGIAGAIAKTCIAPLDRVKIIFQTHPAKLFSLSNVVHELVVIHSREGLSGLWRGNAATVLRVFPYAGIQFAAFDIYKKLLGNASAAQKLLAGSAAGATAVALTYPLDLIRARLAVRMSEGPLSRAAWNDAITGGTGRVTVKELYRGLNPTLIGILPYAGIAFFVRDFLNQLAANRYQTSSIGTPLAAKMASGAVAGLVAQSSTYPLDLVRRRMQTEGFIDTKGAHEVGLQGRAAKYSTIKTTLNTIWREEGMRGMFKGLSMNWIKGPIAFMISFTVFDYIKIHMSLER